MRKIPKETLEFFWDSYDDFSKLFLSYLRMYRYTETEEGRTYAVMLAQFLRERGVDTRQKR